jgi:pimeloyl-ACP methyl ester carboxylesterase
MPTQTVPSADGTTIAFDRLGDGPPIVVVAGAIQHRAVDPSTWQLMELLAPRFTVYRYDRRGRGDSTDTQPYAVEREIEDLAAMIQAAGGSAFVVGGSSGAILSLDAAAHGLPITRLALYEPPFAIGDDTRPALPEDYVERLRELAASGRPGEAIEYFMTVGVLVPPEVVDGMRQAPIWPAFEGVAPTLAYDGAIAADTMSGKPLPTDRWSSVTMPTLVMDGDASPDWMRNGVAALVEVLPNAQHVTLLGQTHAVEPAVLAPALEAFFVG